MPEANHPALHATDSPSVAVLLPCYNEAATIGGVVRGFRASIPKAQIYVYDNNSSDATPIEAAHAGAIVVRERRQGKGHVVRQMFADIEADIYILADGDGTNPPEEAGVLLELLLTEHADMVVACRRNVTVHAGRDGHAFGNLLFNLLYRSVFGPEFSDIFSGYRAFTRRFAKSFPAFSEGFEIETEMSVHASRLMLPVAEIEIAYGRRPEGSHSKLSTFKDGFKILWMFGKLLKQTRPLLLLGSAGVGLAFAGLALAGSVLKDYPATGEVTRLPTLILSTAILLIAAVLLMAGIILDSIAKARAEQLRLRFVAAER